MAFSFLFAYEVIPTIHILLTEADYWANFFHQTSHKTCEMFSKEH